MLLPPKLEIFNPNCKPADRCWPKILVVNTIVSKSKLISFIIYFSMQNEANLSGLILPAIQKFDLFFLRKLSLGIKQNGTFSFIEYFSAVLILTWLYGDCRSYKISQVEYFVIWLPVLCPHLFYLNQEHNVHQYPVLNNSGSLIQIQRQDWLI